MSSENHNEWIAPIRPNTPGNPHARFRASSIFPEANVPGRQDPQRGRGRGIPPPPLPPRPPQDPRRGGGVPPPIPPRPSLDGTTHPHYGAYDGVPHPGMSEPQRGIGHGRPAQQQPTQYGSAGSSYGVHSGGRHFPTPELHGGGIGHGAPAQQPPFDRNHHRGGPPPVPPRPPYSSYGVQDGGRYPTMPEPQPGTGHGFTQQPHLDRSHGPSVLPGYFPQPATISPDLGPYPLGFAGQQSTAPVTAQFQRLAGSVNAAGGSQNSQATRPRTVVSPPASRPIREFPPVPPVNDSLSRYYDNPGSFRDLGPPMQMPQPFSHCTGKKRALIIGINYTHHQIPGMRLNHAINDAYRIARFLFANLGFAHEDIRLMTDKHAFDRPDKKSIMIAMKELVHDAQPHDSLFCYFSGHAVQMPDTTGYELDGLSEAMCAIDYVGEELRDRDAETPGLIVDTEMHRVMVNPLPSQCRLTVIYDCCHSGTLLNLPFIYNAHGVLKEFTHPNTREILRRLSSHADVISLSASKDHQKAGETSLGGALSRAFLYCMQHYGNDVSYKELIESVRDFMSGHRYPQQPQLSSSHEINTNRRFVV